MPCNENATARAFFSRSGSVTVPATVAADPYAKARPSRPTFRPLMWALAWMRSATYPAATSRGESSVTVPRSALRLDSASPCRSNRASAVMSLFCAGSFSSVDRSRCFTDRSPCTDCPGASRSATILPLAMPADDWTFISTPSRSNGPSALRLNDGCRRIPASAGTSRAISGNDSLSELICRLNTGLVR